MEKMRNLKRFISVLLCFIMVFIPLLPVFNIAAWAEEPPLCAECGEEPCICGGINFEGMSGNPIFTSIFTADPSARVWPEYPDKIFVYPSQDKFPARGCDLMDEYHVFSSTNMVDWIDEGEILRANDVPWGLAHDPANTDNKKFMWAPDAMYNRTDGKYYFYFPHPSSNSWNDTWHVGVAVSDYPDRDFEVVGTTLETGTVKFADSVAFGYIASGTGLTFTEGQPITGHGLIDPGLFYDERTDKYYISLGGAGNCFIGELDPNDMRTVLSWEQVAVERRPGGAELPATAIANGRLPYFHEGPWLFERDGWYYLMYPGNIGNRHPSRPNSGADDMLYAMSRDPLGPWEYKGSLLGPTSTPDTSHGSIVEFKNNWYLFYHTADVSGAGTLRTVNVEEVFFNDDGTIKPVEQTKTGVSAVGDRVPANTPGLEAKFYDLEARYNYAGDYSEFEEETVYTLASLYAGGQLNVNEAQFQSNTGAVHNMERSGAYFEVTGINGGNGGQAALTLIYASMDNSNVGIIVNGAAARFDNILRPNGSGNHTLSLPSTGYWESPWGGRERLVVELKPGTDNTIRFNGGAGGFNIHTIVVTLMDTSAPDTAENFNDIRAFALKVNDGNGNYSYVTVEGIGQGDEANLRGRAADINGAAVFERSGTNPEETGIKIYGTNNHIGTRYASGNPLTANKAGPGPWERYGIEILNDGTIVLVATANNDTPHINAGNRFIYAGTNGNIGAMRPDGDTLSGRVELEIVAWTNPINPSGELRLSENSLEFFETDIGSTKTITALGFANANASDKFLASLVNWNSDDVNVATVAGGVVTAVGPGEAKITAVLGSAAAECVVSVDGEAILAQTVTITPAAVEVQAALTVSLSAAVAPSNTTNKTLIWSSSDESIAAVNANGVVTGVSEGTATITAAAADGSGVYGTAEVTVTARPAVVNFGDIAKFALKVNQGNGTYRYVSLNGESLTTNGGSAVTGNNVAIFETRGGGNDYGFVPLNGDAYVCMENNGMVANRGGIGSWERFSLEVLANGTLALISLADHSASANSPFVYANNTTASASLLKSGANANNASRRVEIEVLEYTNPAIPAVLVKIDKDTADIPEFLGTVQLTAEGYEPAGASNVFLPRLVSWTSSDENVATVDANGTVTGIGVGEAVITASAGGTTGTVRITTSFGSIVPTEVLISPAERNLTLGFTAQLTGIVLPENNTNRKLTWSTDNASVVSVDADTGVIRAVAAGTAVITATSVNGITGTSTITVTEPSDGKPNIYTESVTGSDDVILYVKNVLDFGASADGVSDNTQAFQAAVYAARDAGGGVVFAPAGIYAFRGNLHVPTGVTLRGEWRSPKNGGGKGEGTILAVYGGRGTSNLYDITNNNDGQNAPVYAEINGRSFIALDSSGTVRDLSFWWPEQDINNVVPYPFAIGDDTRGYDGSGGNDVINVMNVTMYNAYNGVMSYGTHGCTTVRNMFGTILNVGISEDAAFDIGRLENIYFDSSYWAGSGLEGAPAAAAINNYTRANATGVSMWQNDWGYMFNLNFYNMNIGLMMSDGNCAVSHLTAKNVNYGVYIRAISYPGFKLANSDIEASINAIYYNVASWARRNGHSRTRTNGDLKNGLMQGMEQVAVSNVRFGGNPETAVVMNLNRLLPNAVLSIQNSVFENWQNYAIEAERGSVIIMDNEFKKAGAAIRLASDITAANILGNSFNNYTAGTIASAVPVSRININNDYAIDFPAMPEYDYEFAPVFKPANAGNFYNVKDFGAMGNSTAGLAGAGASPRKTDDTAAIQAALNQAAADGGGTVFMPGGTYWVRGELFIPEGVQLRGTYDAPHTGKIANTAARHFGSVIAVYEDAVNNPDTATINLSANSAVRGITFFYPDQNILRASTGQPATDAPGSNGQVYGDTRVVSDQYPWTVRAGSAEAKGTGAAVTNIALVNAYNGIDMMTYGGDNMVVADINAYALGQQLQMGGGIVGGWVQDVHFNQCNWQQSNWQNNPRDGIDAYAGKYIQAFKFGAMKDVYNFQNFTITVDKAVWLVKEDAYVNDGRTNGVFSGTFNGFAFDSNQVGLEIEYADTVIFINAMSVTDLPRANWLGTGSLAGGPNIRTYPTFTGSVYYYNGDTWGESWTADIQGGDVTFVQYNSWRAPGPVVTGGKLSFYGGVFMHQGTPANTSSRPELRAHLTLGRTAGDVIFDANISYSTDFNIINSSMSELRAGYNLNTSGRAVNVPEAGGEVFEFTASKTGNMPTLTIKNTQYNEQAISGKVEIISPQAYADIFRPVNFSDLAFGESITIAYPTITANGVFLRITSDRGKVYEQKIDLDIVYAESEIGAADAVTMDIAAYMQGGAWEGPQDLSSAVYFAWDEENLYAEITVTDDTHYNPYTGQNIWQGDSVQLGIDLSGSGTNPTRNELGFALNSENGGVVITSWNRLPGLTEPISSITADIIRDNAAGTTTYNLTIPLTTVHPTPAQLDLSKIGIAVQLNDSDEAGHRIWGEPKSDQLKEPPIFTALYLLEDGGYAAMLEQAAETAVDKALASESVLEMDMAYNFIALIKNEAVKSALTAKLEGQPAYTDEALALKDALDKVSTLLDEVQVVLAKPRGTNMTANLWANALAAFVPRLEDFDSANDVWDGEETIEIDGITFAAADVNNWLTNVRNIYNLLNAIV